MNNLTAIRTELSEANRAVSELDRTLKMYKNRQAELKDEIGRSTNWANSSTSYTLSELKNELDKIDRKVTSISKEFQKAEEEQNKIQKKFSSAPDKGRDACLDKIRKLLSKRDECIAEATALDKELRKVISEAEKQNYFLRDKFPLIRDGLKVNFDEIPSEWEKKVFVPRTVHLGGIARQVL